MKHIFFSQVTKLELTPIHAVDGRIDAYCRELIMEDENGYISIPIHGNTEASLQTPVEKKVAAFRDGEYAEYLERGDPLGFGTGYVPNGDCQQELDAYNRWLDLHGADGQVKPTTTTF